MLSKAPGILRDEVRNQLRAAVLLEVPAGLAPEITVRNFSRANLEGLPKRLWDAGIRMKLADVWNSASIVHGGGIAGWGSWGSISKSYDSRNWWQRRLGDPYRLANRTSLHNDVLSRQESLQVIKSTFS